VTVAQPTRQPVTNYLEFNGNTQAVETVELRARVEGFLEKINFEDGSIVRKGQLLFLIDPKPFEAAVRQADAQVAEQRARLDRATIEYARFDRLAKQKAAAETDVLQWRVERDSAQATLAGAEAKRDQAKLDLGYTRVTAPFDGRIGRRLVDLGNLVGSGESTHLATLVRLNPIYAYFNLNELDLLKLGEPESGARAHASETAGLIGRSRANAVVLEMGLANQEGFPYRGKLDFADLGVDPGSGTLLLRGAFPNDDLRILPGLFVRIRAPIGEDANAILVPERAIGTDQRGKYVYTVGTDDKVKQVPVKLGALVDGKRVIVEGLSGDERVVVGGLQRVRDGVPVQPQTAVGDGSPAPAAAHPGEAAAR
jgi:RND family efflux transporter, MFP subunit